MQELNGSSIKLTVRILSDHLIKIQPKCSSLLDLPGLQFPCADESYIYEVAGFLFEPVVPKLEKERCHSNTYAYIIHLNILQPEDRVSRI